MPECVRWSDAAEIPDFSLQTPGPATPPYKTTLQRMVLDRTHGQVTAQAIFLTIHSQFSQFGENSTTLTKEHIYGR